MSDATHSNLGLADGAYEVTDANPGDEPELRRLLREIPMAGFLTVSMQREPDFYHSAGVEGDTHQTVVVRSPKGDGLIALGTRSTHEAFINGVAVRQGYLSQVRISPAYRGGGRLLQKGYARLHAKHQEDPVHCHITTIIEDNVVARRALTSGRVGIPPYTPQGVLCTLLIPATSRRYRELPEGILTCRGTESRMIAIADFLQTEYVRFQFAPRWTAEHLMDATRCRGLRPEDFIVALDGERIVGCLAVWDQRAFKQTVVHRYGLGLGRLIGTFNRMGARFNLPHLPRCGEAVDVACLSHVAVRGDDAAIGLALVRAGIDEVRCRGLAFAAIGLAERHPLYRPIKKAFGHLQYRSILYTVHWDDGAEVVQTLDGRIPHIEIAML